MTRLLFLLVAVILLVASPVAQAFATSHVRPPGAALVQPASTGTELTSGADTEWPWGVIAAWVQAVGTIVAFAGAIFFSSRDHRRSINMFAEERGREEGIRHLRAHSLAHSLYPDLLEAKAKIGACEAAISCQREQRNFLAPPREITQNWKIDIPESLRSAGEMFYLLGTDTAPGVSQLLSLLHQHNRAASKLIEELNDEKTRNHAFAVFWNNEIFANRFQLMKEDVERALDLVRKIRDKDLLPEYTSKAKNNQKDNVAPDGTATNPDDTAPS
jgi:hypothetical protein